MEDEEEAGPRGAGPEEPDWEQGLSPELRQGLRILRDFLVEKHRSLASAFLRGQDGEPGLLAMAQSFEQGRYRDLGDFVAEFRLMLEGCYRRRGVEHWMSKQGQRLEGMLEQKLALLSRPLREKTAIVVTSKGRYGLEDEKAMTCTSTRRRSTPRSLAGSTSGAFESVMVQALRQEEQLKAKHEKRIRELGKKEAEEASYKEIEEWEKNLLAQTAPTCMENMWEIPAIGHFLCLAQQILNLPEIVFYELERCLLIPQSNLFLSKIMTSLLSPPNRRPSLHRRPPLPYKSWEAALRQKVQEWYSVVGQAENTASCAEKLGLGSQFFRALGDVNPLEDKPFHELSFYQKVWLIKGLCDFVYETQIEVQDAVLGQPIHECREVILGYDSQENAYIHFPQFCGADVRIYKQIPFHAPEFPIPPIKIRRLPCIKLEKIKCESTSNSNASISFVTHDILLNPKTESDTELPVLKDSPAKSQVDCCSGCTKHQMKSSCEMTNHRSCDLKDGCCKTNTTKPVSVKGVSSYIDRFCPGEIRVLENGDKYVERPIGKTESSPPKENSFKVCSVHMNGSHSEKMGINFHRKTQEEILERSLLNCKKFKLTKLHGKKKKKKKKKHILNESLHGKYAGPQSQSFKSYKSDIHSKLFFKKKTKHKKHKSGKKSISKRAITKKRKTVSRLPSIPEFQLVCTNLDELRQLITRIDVELKEFGNNRKKSGKSFVKKQTVRDLHSTLKRLLKELLPWEPKLMKAFHRNRARLKKDYDDFKKQPDHDKFIREVWTNEETDVAFGKEDPGIETKALLETLESPETVKKGDHGDTNVPETASFEKRTSPCTKLFPKEMQTTQPKMCKRHCNQNCCVAECTDDILPCKKIKLSVCEYTGHCAESNTQNGCCLNDLKQTEAVAKETIALSASESSFSGGLKLATPVQTLLAKNTGDKVTLTNQLIANASRTINVLEKSLLSSSETSNTKSTLLCQANSKNPLQVVYKMPGGQCVPLNLQSSSVKIQMQPVLDPKTGEKLMQQVLILPKNIFLQHKECKSTGKESVPLQPMPAEQVFATSPQTANVTFSATAPILGTAYSQSSSSVPGKNIAHLTKLSHPTGSPPLPTTVLPSPTKETLSDTNKLTTTTFPLTTALAPVAAAFQPPVLVATLGEDSSSCISLPHEKVQNTSDTSEMKQELKTVCIRDSQSILVRTRGGNTGVVKVQANPENCSTSSLATSSVFTFTPSGQAFLVSRATTAQPSSMLSSVTSSTTVSTALPFAQPTESRFSSPAAIPSCSNQVRGKEVKLAASQPDGGVMGHLPGTTVQPPTYLPSCSLTNSWLPSTSSSSDYLLNTGAASLNTMDSVKMSQPRMAAIAQVTSAPSEMGHATDKLPVLHNSATPANGDLISGAPVQKLLLVTSPVIPSGDGVTVGTIPRPTSTTPTPQKLILINTNISSVSSTSCFAAETTKQMLPSALGKAVLNTPEQPHLVLIPSTVGASIKLCPSATVSQIKEVKIGLNIGQTIINTSGTALNTPPVNLLQNTSCRAAEDKIRKGFVLPITTNNLFPLCPLSQYTIAGNKSRDVGARGSNSFAGTVNLCRGSISATTNTSVATSSGLMNHTNDRTSIGTPSVANRLSASNVGNTVAISTVKTSHLASSVLISTTQSTIPPQSIPTTLFPGVVSFPAPVTNTQKLKNLVPTAVPFLPVPKGLPQAIMRYPSSGNTSSLLPSTNIQTPQALFPSPLTNAKTVIANIASLPHDKSTTALPRNSSPVVSSVVQTPIATAPLASPAGQFGETCIQQKIVLNTNTPLAPGTQIMINGNRFIVPSHGLAAGSHVLLISTNAKQGPPLVLNAQSVQIPVSNQAILKNPQCNLSLQPSKHPLKSSTNIVNSLGSAVVPPIVHASPHVNMMAKSYAASPATANSVGSIPMPQTALVAKTSLDSLRDGGNIIFPSGTSTLHLDKTVKKLLLSPEGAILNSINSVSKFAPLLPANCHILESARKTSPTVLPTPQSSGSENMNIDAS